jgi:hypothetical protein
VLPPIIKFAPLLLLEVLLFVLITGGSLRDLDWFMSLRLDDIEIDLFLDDAEYKRNGSIVVVVVVVVVAGGEVSLIKLVLLLILTFELYANGLLEYVLTAGLPAYDELAVLII